MFNCRTAVIHPNAPVGPTPYNVAQLVVFASRPRTQNPEFSHPIHPRSYQPWMLVRRIYLPGLPFQSCDEGTYGLCCVRKFLRGWIELSISWSLTTISLFEITCCHGSPHEVRIPSSTLFVPLIPCDRPRYPAQVTHFSLWMVE